MSLFYRFPFSKFVFFRVYFFYSYMYNMLYCCLSSCPSGVLFSALWNFLFLSKPATSPSLLSVYSTHRPTNIEKHNMFEVSRQTASLENTSSSLFNFTYQLQLYSWITWFHKTCSLFPTVPSQFSLWQLCFARCPMTHLYFWAKLPVALTKINTGGAVWTWIISLLGLLE